MIRKNQIRSRESSCMSLQRSQSMINCNKGSIATKVWLWIRIEYTCRFLSWTADQFDLQNAFNYELDICGSDATVDWVELQINRNCQSTATTNQFQQQISYKCWSNATAVQLELQINCNQQLITNADQMHLQIELSWIANADQPIDLLDICNNTDNLLLWFSYTEMARIGERSRIRWHLKVIGYGACQEAWWEGAASWVKTSSSTWTVLMMQWRIILIE